MKLDFIDNGKECFNIYDYKIGWIRDNNGTIRCLWGEDILFIVCKNREEDVSTIFDKLRNKKKIAHSLEVITDSKSLQLFTDLFQASINNLKIIDASEIPLWDYRPSKSAERKFDFEIVF